MWIGNRRVFPSFLCIRLWYCAHITFFGCVFSLFHWNYSLDHPSISSFNSILHELHLGSLSFLGILWHVGFYYQFWESGLNSGYCFACLYKLLQIILFFIFWRYICSWRLPPNWVDQQKYHILYLYYRYYYDIKSCGIHHPSSNLIFCIEHHPLSSF